MGSMEAYSEDLRRKIVDAVSRGVSKTETAGLFGASLSSVKRFSRMERDGDSLAPKKPPGRPPKGTDATRRLLLADLAERLADAIRNFTFDPLRNVLVNTVVEGVRPRTLEESEVAIARIRGEDFGERPAKERVDAFADSSVRAVLLQLRGLRIGELRNRVIREDAYRPHRAEVEECAEEIRVLYRAKGRLSVRTFNEWGAASRST